jgi:hypothetical protein
MVKEENENYFDDSLFYPHPHLTSPSTSVYRETGDYRDYKVSTASNAACYRCDIFNNTNPLCALLMKMLGVLKWEGVEAICNRAIKVVPFLSHTL